MRLPRTSPPLPGLSWSASGSVGARGPPGSRSVPCRTPRMYRDQYGQSSPRLVHWRTGCIKGIHFTNFCVARRNSGLVLPLAVPTFSDSAHTWPNEDCAPNTCEIAWAFSASILNEELPSRVSGCRRRRGYPSHPNAETPKSPRRCTYRSHRGSKEPNTHGGLFP